MNLKTPSEKAIALLRGTASRNKVTQAICMEAFAQGLDEIVRKGVQDGDVVTDIFDSFTLLPGAEAKFPVHFLSPGSEGRLVAFDMPAQGRVPERHIEGDEVLVNTFRVANAIDWDMDYSREARFDVVREAIEVYEMGFIEKNNDDGWRVLLACAADRGITINDTAAGTGIFTKELISKMKTGYLRNRGGNAVRGGLTDMYISLEAIEDIRAFTIAEIDDLTRKEILNGGDNPLPTLYGTIMHPMTELGVGQKFQTVYAALGGTLVAGDVENVFGLDLSDTKSFKNPIRYDIETHEDDTLLRQGRVGFFGFGKWGWACLDNRRIIAGSF